MSKILKSVDIKSALRNKQRGFLLNPYRLGGGGVSDPYFANVSLLLHGTGANGSTTITDSSPSNKAVTAYGNARISTSQSKFGGSSMYFDGNGDYLQIPNNSIFNFGASDFTIEAWVYTATVVGLGVIVAYANGSAQNSNYAYQLLHNGAAWQFNVLSANTSYGTSAGSVSANTWIHIALVRSGGSLLAFANGILINTTNVTGVTLNNPAGSVLQIGQGQGYYPWNGYIDDFRITKGVARYTANFTPPTAPFPDA